MNRDTGEIRQLTAEQMRQLEADQDTVIREIFHAEPTHASGERQVMPVELRNISERHKSILKRTGRTVIGANERCPCGSGRKFKRCCRMYSSLDSKPDVPETHEYTRVDGYVWCRAHGCVHGDSRDPYDNPDDTCGADDWVALHTRDPL